MGWEASIRVVDEDGQPRRGAKVTISFSGIIGTIGSEYTDEDGWANFEYESIDDSQMFVDKIWVNGEEVDSGGVLDSCDTRS